MRLAHRPEGLLASAPATVRGKVDEGPAAVQPVRGKGSSVHEDETAFRGGAGRVEAGYEVGVPAAAATAGSVGFRSSQARNGTSPGCGEV